MHDFRVAAFDEIRLVTIAGEKVRQLLFGNARQHRWPGDLVSIQVEDRQDRAIAGGIQKLVGMPTGGTRAGLGFSIAHHAADEQVRIIKGGAIGMK